MSDAEARLATQQNLEEHLRGQLNEIREGKKMEEEDGEKRRAWEIEKAEVQARVSHLQADQEHKEKLVRSVGAWGRWCRSTIDKWGGGKMGTSVCVGVLGTKVDILETSRVCQFLCLTVN